MSRIFSNWRKEEFDSTFQDCVISTRLLRFIFVYPTSLLCNSQGRAIFILRQTLPDFFNVGLVSSSTQDSTPSPSTSSSVEINNRKHTDEPESIYSPKIRLIYTPPVKLPSPFPTTLQVEGTFLRTSFPITPILMPPPQEYLCTWLRPCSSATLSTLFIPTCTSSSVASPCNKTRARAPLPTSMAMVQRIPRRRHRRKRGRKVYLWAYVYVAQRA